MVQKPSSVCLDIKPFKKLFYRGCFYNSLLSILFSYNKNINDLLLNDEIQYQFKNKKDNEYLGIQYKAIRPINVMLKGLGVDFQYSYERYDLIENLINNIDQCRPVIIWVDYFYLPYRTDTYQVVHWGETILIIGYSLKDKIFFAIDQLEKERLKKIRSRYLIHKSGYDPCIDP